MVLFCTIALIVFWVVLTSLNYTLEPNHFHMYYYLKIGPTNMASPIFIIDFLLIQV